ncbi:MAG TPA: DNA ligase D, partial [Polyangiaceae bacterium]|nr:DNA ligase D [Polyangiaceae bacterium]
MSPHPEAPESPLERYASKRNVRTTNEPAGAEPLYRSAATTEGSFVVHLHEATRTHYDLRLEVGGVLKSFAVPRGPSLDPRDRRLAIQTEDHPIEYLEYEGLIPKGNYGAGPMVLWDTGRVRYLERPAEDGLRAGKLDFVLFGYKLRGRFALVLSHRQQETRNEQRQWLLLKKQDAFASTEISIIEQRPRSVLSGLTTVELASHDNSTHVEALAQEYGAKHQPFETRGMQPMLCAELTRLTPAQTEHILNRRGWQYELKLDGVRIVADKHSGEVALWSRRGTAVTQSYPEIARALRALPAQRLVLDGEIIANDAFGRPSFARLARRIHARASDVWQIAREVPVSYFVFDLLAVGDWDLRELPLRKRKELLGLVVRGNGVLRGLDHFDDSGRALFEFCRRERLEGIVAKCADSAYRPGPRRTGDWVKLKCHRDAEFVVVGLTRGQGNRAKLGAIDVASYRGQELVVRGKVGSGLDDEAITTLREKARGIERKNCAAVGRLEPAPNGRVFVEPSIVIGVRFGGWTEDGRLRFPVFQSIRDDLEPQSCVAGPPVEQELEATVPDQVPSTIPGNNDGALEDVVRESRLVKITNPNKVYWPDDGITKGQLLEYYEQVAEVMLPYLADRPVILVRYPDGISGKHFYQWNVPQGIPSWVPTLELPPENGQGRTRQGFLINDRETLRYVVNLGCIPIHMLASRTRSLETCDFITLDLDVEALSLREAITVAHTLRELIEAAGLESFPKTSGQSGLHLIVPLGPGIPYEAARLLVELLGRLATSRHTDIATMQRRRDQRGPRIYVDTGQTGPSRAIVAPYSVRAVPRATVSTPLLWDEVSPALDVSRFDISSVPHRLKMRVDPMQELLHAEP